FQDVQSMQTRLQELSGQICRIEITEGGRVTGYGTGFLVGPEVVLTGYHVLAPVFHNRSRADEVSFLFDFTSDVVGTTLHRAKHDWCVDFSPYAGVRPLPGLPDIDKQLDYVLVRLDGQRGLNAVAHDP